MILSGQKDGVIVYFKRFLVLLTGPSLGPLYSCGFPDLKNFKVGYPRTPNLVPRAFSTVASTLANLTEDSAFSNALAALTYSENSKEG